MTRRCANSLVVFLLGTLLCSFPLTAADNERDSGSAPVVTAVTVKRISIQAARAATRRRDWSRAINHFERALAADEKDHALRAEFAGVLFQAGFGNRSLAEYDRLLAEKPDRETRGAAVQVAMALRDFDDVVARLQAYPEAERASREYRLRLARAYSWTHSYDKSAPLYAALVKETPDERIVRQEYLVALLASNQWEALDREAAAYLERWPDDIEVRLYRIDVLLRGDQLGRAREALAVLEKESTEFHEGIHMRMADLQLACGAEVEEIRAGLEKAAGDRTAPTLRVRLAVLYGHDGQFHRALAILAQAEKEGAQRDLLIAARAELYGFAGMYRTSLEEFDTLVRMGTLGSRGLKGIARAAAPIYRSDDAHSALRHGVIQFPGDMDATYQYLDLLIESAEYKAALKVADTLVAQQPQNITARLLRGRLLAADGREADADQDFSVLIDRLVETGTLAAMRQGHITKQNLKLVPSKVWRAVVARAPDDTPAAALLARALYREVEFRAAEAAWAVPMAAEPDEPLYRLGLVETLVARGVRTVEGSRQRVESHLPALIAAQNLPREGQVRLAELLVRTERWEDLVTVTGRMLEQRPDDTLAVALRAGALMALEHEPEALQTVNHFLAQAPDNELSAYALWTRLGAMAITAEDPAYRHSADALRAMLDRSPGNLDVQMSLGWLHTILREYDEGRVRLEQVLAARPTDGEALLWRARLESWDEEYDTALEYYARYEKANPTDRRLCRERARVLSWALEFRKSTEEYTRGIIAAGATDPPREEDSDWAKALYLEREAKAYKWNKREWHAVETYDQLLSLQPEDPEINFDRGQMDTRLGFSRRASDYYERTLLLAPGHSQARAALEYERHRLNGSIREKYSFRKEKGFSNAFAIEEHLLTTTWWSPEIGDMWWLGAELERGWYFFKAFRDPTANRAQIMGRKRFYSGLQLDAWYQYSRYSAPTHGTNNFGLESRYKAFDFVETLLSIEREDVLENYNTIALDIQRYNYKVGLASDVTRRLRVDAWGAWVHVDDGNDGRRGRASASYEILQYPRLLKLSYSVEYWDYDRQNRVYFAPSQFIQHGPMLHWRHYLNREHYSGVNELYYGVKVPLLFDNHGHNYPAIGAEFLWDITNQWQIGADASYTDSGLYRGSFVTAWLRYRF